MAGKHVKKVPNRPLQALALSTALSFGALSLACTVPTSAFGAPAPSSSKANAYKLDNGKYKVSIKLSPALAGKSVAIKTTKVVKGKTVTVVLGYVKVSATGFGTLITSKKISTGSSLVVSSNGKNLVSKPVTSLPVVAAPAPVTPPPTPVPPVPVVPVVPAPSGGGGGSSAPVVDTTRPTVVITDNNAGTATGDVTYTFTFSEAVTGFTASDVTLVGGTAGAFTVVSSTVYTLVVSPAANSTANITVDVAANVASDLASTPNGNAAGSQSVQAVDTVPPTATVVLADSALTVGETTTVTVTFSEAPTGFVEADDLTVANGALSGGAFDETGLIYTATFTPTANVSDTTNVITLGTGWTDAATNAPEAATDSANYTVETVPAEDTVPPTATVVLADSALTVGETTTVTVTFSEAPTGFVEADDLTVANGALSGGAFDETGLIYTATFTPTANVSDTTNVITLGTGWTDAATNAPEAATDSANYTVETVPAEDTVPPTATVVLADSALTVGETTTVTVTFSEAPTGFVEADDLTVANGALSGGAFDETGLIYTATFTPTANVSDTTNVITLGTGWTDAATNAPEAATDSANYTVETVPAEDTVPPTATVVLADSALTVGETTTVTVTFSEAPTGFVEADDLTVANGALSGGAFDETGLIYTATFTPTANVSDTTNVITLGTGWTDAATNAPEAATDSANYTVETVPAEDTVPPTATVVLADSALTVGETTTVTVTFSEAPTGFVEADDLTVANGALSGGAFDETGLIYTATFTPTANVSDTTNVITLGTGWTDAATNAPEAATDSANYTVETVPAEDTVPPTATVVLADSALTVGETTTVTVTFSEAPTGFVEADDLTVANGALSGGAFDETGLIYTATFTPTANVSDTTNVITLGTGWTDAATNAPEAATDSANYTVETVPAEDTVPPTATVVLADSALTVGETTTVTVTFSEAPTGFVEADDLTVANGALSGGAFDETGLIYTATFTPTANVSDTTNVITLGTGWTDAATNAPEAATDSANYTVETTE